MSTCRLALVSLHYKNLTKHVVLVQSRHFYHLIRGNNMLSPWYSRKNVAHLQLALTRHSPLTPSSEIQKDIFEVNCVTKNVLFGYIHNCMSLFYLYLHIMKRIFKQWWSSIPPTSTKRTITSHLNSLNITKRPWHMMLEIQVLTWDRHKNVVGLNRLMGSQSSCLHNWISNSKLS